MMETRFSRTWRCSNSGPKTLRVFSSSVRTFGAQAPAGTAVAFTNHRESQLAPSHLRCSNSVPETLPGFSSSDSDEPSHPEGTSFLPVLPLRPPGPSRLREESEVGDAPLDERHPARRCPIFSRQLVARLSMMTSWCCTKEYPASFWRPNGEAAGEYRSSSNLFPSTVRMS